jgi:hypothetical protein
MIDVSDIQTDLTNCEHRIRVLQSETIHCIAFKPSGKIEVVDKEQLETLNGEIDRLKDLEAHNIEVLTKLTAALQDYPAVADLRKKKLGLEEQIARTKNLLRIDTGDLIKHVHDVNPADPYAHPKGKLLKEKADEALAITTPLLADATNLLAQAEAIISEFKPSGVQAMPEQHPQAITREKVLGLVG